MSYIRDIKKFPAIKVQNALSAQGYVFNRPKHPPTNIQSMLHALPLPVIKAVHARLTGQNSSKTGYKIARGLLAKLRASDE